MNASHPSAPDSTASRWFELLARSASGAVMGVTAVAALVGGGLLFSGVIAVGALAALREWHRLMNAGRIAREMVLTGVTVVGALVFVHWAQSPALAILSIVVGASLAATSAALRRNRALWPIPWHALGVLYIGIPALTLVLLREGPRGAAIVGAVFVAVWTADTGALFFGRSIGGPKLAPGLSPNKTWAGFVGGTIAAGVAEALYVDLLGGNLLTGGIFGMGLALSGHCGDLFESWVKRQFHAKNTGTLIPGHGGMLDRIDSLLFAAPACAVLVYILGFSPFAGGAA